MRRIPAYAELRCVSNFSFLRGASQPEELVERAYELGYSALALTDECSLAGIVRAHVAAKKCGLHLVVGSQFHVHCDEAARAAVPAFVLTVLANNLNGYGNLSQFITKLRRSSDKGTYQLAIEDVTGAELADCVVLCSPKRMCEQRQLDAAARWLLTHFMGRCWFGVELIRVLDDEAWLHRLRQASEDSAIPLVAVGDVHFHVRSRKPLQDVLTATRVGRPLTDCGLDLQPNAERHLRTRLRLAQTYPADLLDETLNVTARCCFSLDELKYQYPDEVVPAGHTPASYLRKITYEGAGQRWPQGMPAKVQQLIEYELSLVAELRYEHYFLTVADIVMFARSRGILCQGRGSAANSVICYCVGVTEVDPARMSVLVERFISKERNEPPDIDIDFEHERREEVLQYLYNKYGRDRAAITGVVISYRPKSAIRDVGKALGFSLDEVDTIAKGHQWWDGSDIADDRVREAGLEPDDLRVQQLLQLTRQLLGFPRHLSQHTGGMVLTKGPLSRIVPIENASMADRTVIEWDKDDLDAMGLLKVDCLALGMLTAIRKALDFIGERQQTVFGMQDIPAEDTETYDMICKADTVGVFQIESRAQMSMLPRHRPRCFYDLVVQVAIVRPGPIVGGMVHPYIRRRQGLEPVTYPSAALEEALGRTLGVPVFQEQVMQIAMLAAGYTAGEADGLRRDMAAWKRKGGLAKHYDRIVDGMTSRGYEKAFAEQIFKQIHGFSEYGFPESHAGSFALLVYASCWIKRHHPAEFLAALINSQPMGFYSPSQLVRDAKAHGVEVRAPDVLCSDVDCTLEDLPHPPAVRLGLRLIAGLVSASATRIVEARSEAAFESADDLARRAGLEAHEMKLLAAADALASLSGHRRQQVWDAAALRSAPPLLTDAPIEEELLELPAAPEGEEILFDYASLGLTLRRHPLALLRERLTRRGLSSAADLATVPNGRRVDYCGIVTLRQQPSTASGTIFVSLEDETGTVQAIVWKSVRDQQRDVLLRSRLLVLRGTWQREGDVCNLIVSELEDLTPLLGRLAESTHSRDFH
ncbi:error-prone DNA polymerase [Rhizobacter sp. OV335]|uniref:error-prone DNA polymerase n=1 Tax=Rhizobacter sp. OV335 TaxID=1500264 RepID=UPI0009236351|nr:error-prone DNA polymerase [Rhizobacter sp. OV335]SHN13747.1 error-prone DNA polymerase, DnaE-like [Rhizobacter sp. OV335]